MKFQVLDMFSGCGGLSWGFHNRPKSYVIVGAIDLDQHANKTYETNYNAPAKNLDIENLDAGDLSESFNLETDRPLIVIGGPPCQGFSSHKKKDKKIDLRNSLVAKYVDLCCNINADVIVIENVPDLFTEKHWHHFAAAKDILISKGYQVNASIVNMAEYGVPQERFRAVVIASKIGNITVPKGFLERNKFKTVRNAISMLPPLKAGGKCSNDLMHFTSKHRAETIDIFKSVPKDGGSRPIGVGPKCLDKVKGFSDVYGRLYWDQPAVTITARCRTPSCGRFMHPEQDRGLSVREAALLQSFPSDFYFEGPFDEKYKQIGNAVPPKFSDFLADHIINQLQENKMSALGATVTITKPIGKSFSTLISFIKKGRKIEDFVS